MRIATPKPCDPSTALSCSSIGVVLRKRRREVGEWAMARIRWRMVVQYLTASIAFELLGFVCVRSRLDVATAVYLYLIALVRSLRASLLVWAIFSLIIFDCLAFFLSPAI